jgi:hypothetical protein
MFNKAEVFRKIEELAKEYTTDNGRFDLHIVQEQLAVFLDEHRKQIDVVRLAIDYVNEFDRNQRPKPHAIQMGFSFFQPIAWIPTGNKERVQMAKATRIDMIAWAQIEISEHAASAAAHARKMEYINSRLNVWDNKCKSLGELEAKKFQGDQGQDAA